MRIVVLLLLALAWPVAALAQPVEYRAEIAGIDGGLRDKVMEQSRLIQSRDDPPSSLVALSRRAEADLGRIREVLRSEGHYAGTATFDIDEVAQPVIVRLTVDPGPVFALQSYDIQYAVPAGHPIPTPVPLENLGLEIGQPAEAKPIVASRARLLNALADQGFPLATIGDNRNVVDHATATMRVEMGVETGPQARFGPVSITGLRDVKEKYIRRRLTWEQGDVFSVSRIEELRKRLVETRLFTSMRIDTGTEVDAQGQLPIAIALEEAKHRSIGFGANWSSDRGFSGEAFWEHRNVMDGGERLRAALVGGEVRSALDLTYREPDFRAADQNLLLAAMAEEQRTDAFNTRTLGASGGVEWSLNPTWTASVSLALERTFEEENDDSSDFTLVSVPLELRHDTTDDPLDPTRGNRLRTLIRPFVEPPGTSGFTLFDVQDSQYLKLRNDPRLILAGWARAAIIRGASAQEVPADKRLYVGGGGSVRAFGYQMAGPVDAEEDPVGGLSALAFGTELRINVTDSIGIVPFVEAGRADSSKTPGGPLFWGGGLGLRYHTPVGPVRADIAVPFNPRSGIDDSYVVYLSLGQAF